MSWKTYCDLSSEDAQYSYCANGPAALFFTILFGLTWIAHFIQSVMHRKKFCWVIVVATGWECVGMIMRTYSTIDQTKSGTTAASQLLVLLAPLWMNAFVYMIFGRMVYYYLPERKVVGIRAERLALIFIWLDVGSFIVQATGGIMSSDISAEMNKIGLHIYTAGIAAQQFFILCFCGLLVVFQRRMQDDGSLAHGRGWRTMTWAMWATLVFITIRIIYRLVEFADTDNFGDSVLTLHEAPFYCLECLPMFVAMLIWNVWHPGRYLKGDESDFPKKVKVSRSEKKMRKQEAKDRKRRGNSFDESALESQGYSMRGPR